MHLMCTFGMEFSPIRSRIEHCQLILMTRLVVTWAMSCKKLEEPASGFQARTLLKEHFAVNVILRGSDVTADKTFETKDIKILLG